MLLSQTRCGNALCCTQWVTLGDVDVDIGANPSAEEADEGTDSTSRKVVDIVDSFRLVVGLSIVTLVHSVASCVFLTHHAEPVM